jgi:hypothetical protein
VDTVAVDGEGVGAGGGVDCRVVIRVSMVIREREAEGERVGEVREMRLTPGVVEVQDAVLLEHVDLLDTGKGLNVELLQRGLELLVVDGSLRLDGDLSADGGLRSACSSVNEPGQSCIAESSRAAG